MTSTLVAARAVTTPSTIGPPAGSGAPAGLPPDGPPALYEAEPALPAATGWPGPADFSRTSGTGRLDEGAFLWTDFLYDDHGAIGAGVGNVSTSAGTPSFGTYTYPSGPADSNGADIFTAGVLLKGDDTYWRVDWTTLADPTVPIAEWTFDQDDNAATGGSVWPGGANVESPGIDTALVVSSRLAQLISVPSDQVIATYPVTVDRTAQSFVVEIPTSVLRPTGTWRVRLGAGLANASGTGFATATGALPGESNLYNVTFRTIAQEPDFANFWDDDQQALALTTGNVSKFSATLDWSQLADHVTTPQPQPTGWSDRWYASTVDLGEGEDAGLDPPVNGDPQFLGAIQPYAIYVPTSYNPSDPTPVTFLLHSSNQNHNQYAATTPNLTAGACEDRHSICLSPLGRGPQGSYWDVAELDFWQVWHDASLAYNLDPDRTVLAGYSMGGIGANQLAMEHPDLFARSITLAGGVGEVPQAVNLQWVPTYLAGGLADELVPVPLEIGEADQLNSLGYRYRWLLYPAEDHVSFELEDGFSDAIAYMGDGTRMIDPGHITFNWDPVNTLGDALDPVELGPQGSLATTQDPAIGVGTTGDYWLRDLTARDQTTEAQVTAVSGERPDPAETPSTHTTLLVPGDPTPAVATELTWAAGAAPAPSPTLSLTLTNVSSVTVLLADAGFAPGTPGVLHVTSDGPGTVVLGARAISVGSGTTTIAFTA
jgi:pimeloyl-ACP methyl ester carboxylesterase